MPIVTISRGTLSGGEALAQCLSERSGYPSMSREVIKDAASLYGISEAETFQQLMSKPKFIERVLGEKRRLYIIALQSALAERALKGNFIYHGLAGHFLLQGVPSVFKVRLVAPMEYRVKTVMEKKNLSKEEARKYIDNIDDERRQWTRFLYHIDWTDPSLYDTVINIERMSLNTACTMIMSALNGPEFRDAPEKHLAIENFALASQIKAKLALNPRTRGIILEVEAHQGNVKITGKVITGKGLTGFGPLDSIINRCKLDILEIAKAIPGVKEIEIELEELQVAIE